MRFSIAGFTAVIAVCSSAMPAASSFAGSNGIIPFGSSDPSVIFQSSLTSAASIVAVGGGTVVGSPGFDAVDGMIPGLTGGAYFQGGFRNTESAGQLSLEVERTLISQPSPDQISDGIGGSQGYNHLADGWQTLLDIRATDGSQFASLGLTELAAVGGGYGHTSFTAQSVHSAGKSDFVRLTLSWTGTTGQVYIDGLLQNTFTGYPAALDVGAIAVGFFAPGLAGVKNYHVRNLVLAGQPVVFPVHPQLETVVIYGDSFAWQANDTLIGSTEFEATAGFQILRDMNNAGMSIGQLVIKAYPGQVLNKNPAVGQVSFQLGTNSFGGTADKLTDVVNANADYVIIMGGTNDATGDATARGEVAPNFATDLLSMCRTILNNPMTKGIIVQTLLSARGNATYATPTYVANVAAINAIIRALPSVWNSTYPVDAGKIKVVDTFTATGGEAAAANMEKGTLTGALNDLHPAAFASVISGNLISGALQGFLATTGEIAVNDCTTVPNGVILQSTATLSVELGGAVPCTGYGRYTVAQSLALKQPTLDVTLANGFKPAAGGTFQILSWAAISGAFGAVSLPALTAGFAWDLSALYTTGTIAVGKVPMPTLSITAGDQQSFVRGTSAAPVAFSVGGSGPLTVSATSGNPALVPGDGLVVSPKCGSAALLCSLKVTVAAGQTGSAILRLHVQDSYGQAVSASARIIVTAPP